MSRFGTLLKDPAAAEPVAYDDQFNHLLREAERGMAGRRASAPPKVNSFTNYFWVHRNPLLELHTLRVSRKFCCKTVGRVYLEWTRWSVWCGSPSRMPRPVTCSWYHPGVGLWMTCCPGVFPDATACVVRDSKQAQYRPIYFVNCRRKLQHVDTA